MKSLNRVVRSVFALAFGTSVAWLLGCSTEDPTEVVVDNDEPPVPDGGDPSMEMTVYKVWWGTTLMPDPVAPGGEGQAQRTVPITDFAYAVFAPAWDPQSGASPSRFFVTKSVSSLGISRGDTLHVHVSDATFIGNCTAGKPLSQEDADFITTRVFPAEFEGLVYDAASCTTGPQTDAGPDAAQADAGPDAAQADAGLDAAPTEAGPDAPQADAGPLATQADAGMAGDVAEDD